MTDLASLGSDDLIGLHDQVQKRYAAFAARGLKLDMTRGKPSEKQLDLSNALLAKLDAGAMLLPDGTDCRNYTAGLPGIPEARALFAGIMGAPATQIIIGGNSSLELMHDSIVYGLMHGVPGGAARWSTQGEVTFLCPSPGYDRHFALCEGYGIRMVPVALTGEGPDMDAVEKLVKDDPQIKGIWCIPKYSNPTGEVYSDRVVQRLAAMAAAPDFRIFWDNAYAVHHLTKAKPEIANILEACAKAGHPDRALVFASTSKITFAGGGLAFFASSPENYKWFLKHMTRRTIGPDKVNQVRHVQLLRDDKGIAAHMEKHKAILAPKFKAVDEALTNALAGTGAARWTKPDGGYFISLDVRKGCAKRVVELAKQAGVLLTGAGQTFPYAKDPQDSNLRLAPSFPPLDAVTQAAEGIAVSILLATTEAILAERGKSAG